ncbi:MAG: tyrosine-type recombinase/integrase [Holophaga sp.]|nr:tyrosine-type recombinase/integrase [Holophaga sp.]
MARAAPKPARRAKLTDEFIASLQSEAKQFYVWDAKHKGLGVRVGSSGKKSFVLKLSLPGKRSDWKTLEASTMSAAVVEYHDLMAKFGRGEALPTRQTEALWQDLVDRFEKEHLQHVKPTTAVSYRSALKLIREALRNRPVRVLTYEDVKAFHAGMADRPRQANVAVQLCKLIFDRAEAWKMRDLNTNPVDLLRKSGWKPNPEEQRDVRLSDEQLQKIGDALTAMEAAGKESSYTIAAVRLLFFTGRRLREVLGLKWSQVDLDGRNLVIEHHKTDGKVGTLKTPLNDAALEVLQSLERLKFFKGGKEVEHPYVLPGNLPRDDSDEEPKPINDLRKFWGRMAKLAGMELIQKESGEATTFRRHDLRHAHGNAAADLDMTLQTTAALLGHKDAHTSARYSKAGENKALAASQKVSGSLKEKMGRKG